ncbi:hypothetical protein BB559_005788 [Furculomyces boomerangus]|uniref:2-methoxy-6-polyprenyl-1,4-benzoquinol methylase, mitochondrial n=2 Tax=Harpellales TaxID=61421 RepID=A0A2T9Y6L2_9FUNG|nr:hypothetical protein BB559_005788 [Furculomyces boomerangus]PVZ99516.1 hypothetical protein BB558_004540 [Smittium angustum]
MVWKSVINNGSIRAQQKHLFQNSVFRNKAQFQTQKEEVTQDQTQNQSNPNNQKDYVSESAYTHFGFKSIPESSKEKLVGNVFSSVATKYDIMNDAMSGGIHRIWKDHFIRTMNPLPGTKLIDMAGGTGDITARFLNYTKQKYSDDTSTVHMVDINPEMLEEGKKRFENTEWYRNNQIKFDIGNAEDLNFIEDETYDVYTIAFGIRNCTHVDKVVKEAYRVLKRGGCFMCLEFGKVNNPIISEVYDFFSFKVIPDIGGLIANDRDSYKYLVESIRKFPDQETFSGIIKDAGFVSFGKGYEDLTFGVASIHTGYKL